MTTKILPKIGEKSKYMYPAKNIHVLKTKKSIPIFKVFIHFQKLFDYVTCLAVIKYHTN